MYECVFMCLEHITATTQVEGGRWEAIGGIYDVYDCCESMYLCIYVHHVCMCVCVCMYTMYVCMYVCVFLCHGHLPSGSREMRGPCMHILCALYVCMNVCSCVCVSMYICMHA